MNVRAAFLSVTLAALALRLAFVIAVRPLPVSDFGWYFARAIEISGGLGYLVRGHPTAFWPPGWPYTLSLVVHVFGPSVLAGEILQAILNALTVGFAFLIGRAVFGTGCGLIAAAFYALLPSAVEWSAALGSEPLYTFLWAAATYIWIRYTPDRLALFAVSGVILGLAALVRPSALLLWVILLVYVLTARRERKQFLRWLPAIAITVFCTAIVVTPWTLRNYGVFHQLVVVSNNGGVSLYQGNNQHAGGGYTTLDNPRIEALIADPRTEIAGDHLASDLAKRYILAHPGREFVLALRKIKSLYEGDRDVFRFTFRSAHFFEPVSPPPSDKPATALLIVNTLYYYVLMLFAIAGCAICFYRSKRGEISSRWLLLFWIVVYNTAVFALVMGLDRYRYPTMPYFSVFAAYGLACAIAYAQQYARAAPLRRRAGGRQAATLTRR